jgi:hypothetical protein
MHAVSDHQRVTYGPSRIGKTRAIEYLRLLLAQTQPKITTYHAQAEHKPRHAEFCREQPWSPTCAPNP